MSSEALRSPAWLILVLLTALLFTQPSVAQVESTNLSGIQVALYTGGPTSGSSRESLFRMFSWMNATVTILSAASVKNGELSDYDVVVLPGGYAPDYIQDLGSSGLDEIRVFVRNGGAFFGVCAGAYFAADSIVWEGSPIEYRLDLFRGQAVGAIDAIAPWPTYDMCNITLNHTSNLIDFSLEPDNHTVMYYGGPYFLPDTSADVEVLATYHINNEAAMIAFEYEQGRVFLSGPHPEWEEDSNRDGATWNDVFMDNGSEWDMMLSATLWLVERSTTTTTSTTAVDNGLILSPEGVGSSMIVIGVIGTIVVLLYMVKNHGV